MSMNLMDSARLEDSRMPHLDQLLSQGRTYFQAKDYQACMTLISQVLSENPANAEAAWLMKEAQRQWEDQRSMEELEIYVENLKKEGMDLFDKEQYDQCLGIFRFLVQLEPENQMVRDYLKLSQQMFLETIESERPAVKSDTEECAEVSAPKPASTTLSDPPPELPSSADGREGLRPSLQQTSPALTDSGPEAIAQAEKQRAIDDYLASRAHKQRQEQKIIWLSASALLLAVLAAACFWFYLSVSPASSLDIQSRPEGANVFINDQLKGKTHLRIKDIPAGIYQLRVEKEGYAPYSERLALRDAQAALLAVHLEKLKTESQPDVQSLAPVSQEGELPVQPLDHVVQEPKPKTQSVAHISEGEPSVQSLDSVSPEPATGKAKDQIDQVAYSVIHHHVLGSCTGRLKINGDMISFRPSGSSNDGFTRRVSQIDNTQLGEKLTIQFDDKAYRFQPLAGNNVEDQRKLLTIYRVLKSKMTQTKRRAL
jgi:hypothetical protein